MYAQMQRVGCPNLQKGESMFNDNTDPMLDTNMVDRLEQKVHMMEELGIDDPITFSSRTLIQATFPHSYRIDRQGKELTLTNGNLTITMYGRYGLPYGHYPRLILCWLTKQALRRQYLPISEARIIPLGDNLNQFLRDVGILKGITPDGGVKRADGRQLKYLQEQMRRLFTTVIGIDVTGKNGVKTTERLTSFPISCDTYFEWWDITNPANDDLYDYSYINLSEDFYREIVEGAVPLDMLHLAQISRKPLAIDLYCWATYRISYQKHDTHLTWQQLKAQLGTGYPNTPQGMRDFKKKVKKAIEDVKAAWPEAGIELWTGGVKLVDHTPAVMKKDIPINPDLPPQF